MFQLASFWFLESWYEVGPRLVALGVCLQGVRFQHFGFVSWDEECGLSGWVLSQCVWSLLCLDVCDTSRDLSEQRCLESILG